MLLENKFGDDEVDERIAEELEPLVIVLARAAMRQRLRQQRGIGKCMTERGGRVIRHRRC